MHRVLLIASVLALAGCDGAYFPQPLVGERFFEQAWNGAWTPTDEWARELLEPDNATAVFKLQQPLACEGATLVVEGCDDVGGEEEDCGTISAQVEFVRLNERVFANLRVISIDGEPQVNHPFEVFEVRDVSASHADIAIVDTRKLTELIDSGQLAGTYKEGPHGPIFDVTASGAELADMVAREPEFFTSATLRFDRSE